MKKRKTLAMGWTFKRKSRLTGKKLANWWIAYHHNGKERRESANTTSHADAVIKLRNRLKELSDGTYVSPDQERVCVTDILDGLVTNYENRERTSLDTVRGHVRLWKQEIGSERAPRLSTVRLQRIVQQWKKAGSTQVKNRQPHEIALDGRPLEIIRRRSEARKTRGDLACPYIFDNQGKSIGDFKRAWASACQKAGFPLGRKSAGYVFHNTRHTAVTNLVNAGVPSHEAMGVSGHRTRSVFDRYSIKLHEQTRAALRKATEYVQGLSKEPKVVQLPSHQKTGR